MNLLAFLRGRPKPTAECAKERLQILLAHERADLAGPDYLQKLKTELLQVIAKYVPIDNDKIAVKLENAGSISTLEVNIELPIASELRRSTAASERADRDGVPADVASAPVAGAA